MRLTGSDLEFLGAGDGNRTGIVSLGICAVQASTTCDMQGGQSLSDREDPPFTGLSKRARRSHACRMLIGHRIARTFQPRTCHQEERSEVWRQSRP